MLFFILHDFAPLCGGNWSCPGLLCSTHLFPRHWTIFIFIMHKVKITSKRKLEMPAKIQFLKTRIQQFSNVTTYLKKWTRRRVLICTIPFWGDRKCISSEIFVNLFIILVYFLSSFLFSTVFSGWNNLTMVFPCFL